MKRRLLTRLFAYLMMVLFLLLTLVIGLVGFLLHSHTGTLWLFDLATELAPGMLQVDTLEGSLSGPLEISGLSYHDGDLILEVNELQLNWLPRALLQGRLHILSLSVKDTRLKLPNSAPSDEPKQPFNGLSLPLKIAVDALNISNFQVTPPDAKEPIKVERLALQARVVGDKLTLVNLEGAAFSTKAKLAGILHLTSKIPMELNVAWRYQLLDGPELRGKGRVSGDLAELQLAQTLKAPLSGQLTATLFELEQALSWDAQLQLDDADIAAFTEDFPAHLKGQIGSSGNLEKIELSAKLNLAESSLGELAAEFQGHFEDGNLKTERLLLTSSSGIQVEGRGHYHLDDGADSLAVELNWSDLRWPLTGETVQFRSAKGDLGVTGHLNDYRYRLHSQTAVPNLPPAQIDSSGTGNLESLTLDKLEISLSEGMIQGSGQVGWLPELNWQLQLNGEALNPALFYTNFPGKLNLVVTSEGKVHAGVPSAKVHIQQLEGVLLERPLQASGDINLADKTVSFNSLKLLSGANQAQLDGSIDKNLNLDWSVHAPQLETLWPWLSGALYGSGRVNGPSTTPRIKADIHGEQIAYQDNRVEKFNNQMDLDLGKSQKVDLTLQAENLQAGGMHWESLNTRTKGVIDNHHIELTLQGKEVPEAWLIMDAGLSQEYHLSGILQRLRLDTPDLGSWQLVAPTAFALSMETQELAKLCLKDAESRLCGEFNADIKQGWQAAVQVSKLPLAYLQRWIPAETQITGQTNLKANFTADPQGTIQGSADLSLPKGKLNFELEGEPQVVDFSGGQAQLVIDQQGGQAKLTLPLGSLGDIKGEAALPELKLAEIQLEEQVVEGQLSAHLEDLAIVSAMAPHLQNVHGHILADFSLSGRLAKPQLQGQAELKDGALDIPEIGIELRKITLRAQASDLDRLTLEGSVESGDGVLNLSGETQLQLEQGFPSKLRIQGKDWVAVNVPEAEVHISPDINVDYNQQRTTLEGDIHIPYARIRLRRLPESAVSSSSDLVIVGGDSPSQQQEDPRLYATVRLILGDRVSFDGLGLRAQLTGNLQVIDEPGRPVMGRGRIGITEGTYRAYGQDLRIEHGFALFADSPVDNPGLDVRAVREAGEVTAGVRVTGTLRSPNLTLFSTPTMNKTAVVSYLLTGRAPGESGGNISLTAAMMASGAGNITEEIGRQLGLEELRLETANNLSEASVVAGTYLSPRLYVQFVNDLVTRETILRLRYDLTDRLQIQTESGRSTGADIFYIIER